MAYHRSAIVFAGIAGLTVGLFAGAPAYVSPLDRAAPCAEAISADLDAAAESATWQDVPAPEFRWIEAACAGIDVPDVAGTFDVYEDGTYVIRAEGDVYAGCAVGGECNIWAGVK